MKKTIVMEKYPVFSLEAKKDELKLQSVDEIISYYNELIEKDPVARYIGVFDHYNHTKSLKNYEISDNIKEAKNILFCFGQKITNPIVLSARPRSISVVQEDENFVISFIEAPNPSAQEKMEKWTKDLIVKK